MRLENLDGSSAFMSFDSADMKRERKSLRFSWSRRVDYDNGYRYNYEQVSIEIVWTDKSSRNSTLWVGRQCEGPSLMGTCFLSMERKK